MTREEIGDDPAIKMVVWVANYTGNASLSVCGEMQLARNCDTNFRVSFEERREKFANTTLQYACFVSDLYLS